jgi:hypothetical protein
MVEAPHVVVPDVNLQDVVAELAIAAEARSVQTIEPDNLVAQVA